MVKSKISNRKKEDAPQEAVLNLTIDGNFPDAQVRENVPPTTDAFQTPCSVNGLMAGISGGTLGYAFGFAGYWFSNRLKGTFRGSLGSGWASAKTFGIMGGLYAAVSCFMLRLRQKQDAWNGAASGCATGLALGWAGGPARALQSCATLGAFSYFLDGMSGADTAHAAGVVTTQDARTRSNLFNSTATEGAGQMMENRKNINKNKSPLELLLTPAIPLLHALNPCNGGRCLTDDSSSGSLGCAVLESALGRNFKKVPWQ
ncbi:hypothetical protein Ndes2526B_g03730 [Nannochloris sp. 'desiccata']|nr:hypothetical protein KSW81_005405 [Chlorella desiccata (nom. nud.)]KAH7621387.1 putative Mitochondrial import inner membrane translocase subunit TIM22-3 [Chlorella desiccata (nom. nud.)]